jgi:hypothetical protein
MFVDSSAPKLSPTLCQNFCEAAGQVIHAFRWVGIGLRHAPSKRPSSINRLGANMFDNRTVKRLDLAKRGGSRFELTEIARCLTNWVRYASNSGQHVIYEDAFDAYRCCGSR